MSDELDENCAEHDSPCCEVCAYERGYRAGIEAAARVVEADFGPFSGNIRAELAADIRALAPAAQPRGEGA